MILSAFLRNSRYIKKEIPSNALLHLANNRIYRKTIIDLEGKLKKPMNTEALKLENQVCFPLYATSRIITKLYQPYLNQLEITYTQYLVLMVLWENDHRNVTDICSCLLLETSTLTPLLKRLEAKDFIRRTRSSADERSVIIALTDKGLRAKDTAASIPVKIFESIKSDKISEEDILHVKSVLTEIIRLKA